MQTISTRIPTRTVALVRALSIDPAPAQQAPTVASNNIAPSGYAPVTVSTEIHAAATVDVPDFDGPDDEADVAAEAHRALQGTAWAGLVLAPSGPTAPASNDEPVAQSAKCARRKAAVNPDAAAAIRETRDEMAYRKITGERLIRAREATGLGQFEAARQLLYTSPTQMALWEAGKRMPPLSEVVRCARLYGTTVDFLLGESPEMDKDPAISLRTAVLRGVRTQLSRATEIVCDEVARHTRLVGGNVITIEGVIAAGDALLDAVANFQRINIAAVEDMRGSARLVAASEGFERELHGARQKIRLAQALDGDLRRALAALPDADPALPTDEA